MIDSACVVAALFNPTRSVRRTELYADFVKHVRRSGVNLLTVEAIEPESRFEAMRRGADFVDEITLQETRRIWLKEGLMNAGLRDLPPSAKYVALVDADVTFVRPDWVQATVEALQKWPVVQMFSCALDMGPRGDPFAAWRGFGWCWHNGFGAAPRYGNGLAEGATGLWHPGFAWAWRRETIEAVGGLIDFAITGSGDSQMAPALVGEPLRGLHPGFSEGYQRAVMEWSQRATAATQGQIGWVDGTILHGWHGRKRSRGYTQRRNILVEHGFDPAVDLERDEYGLPRLKGNKPELASAIRAQMESWNEDSMELPAEEDKLLSLNPMLGKERRDFLPQMNTDERG